MGPSHRKFENLCSRLLMIGRPQYLHGFGSCIFVNTFMITAWSGLSSTNLSRLCFPVCCFLLIHRAMFLQLANRGYYCSRIARFSSIRNSNSNPYLAGGKVGSSNRSFPISTNLYQGSVYTTWGHICSHILLPGQLRSTPAPYFLDSRLHNSPDQTLFPSHHRDQNT